MDVSIAKRISPGMLKGTLTAIENPIELGKIGCKVVSTRQVANRMSGEASTQLQGDFLAILPDGRALKSATLYLPEFFSKQVAEAQSQANGAEIKFAVTLKLVKNENSPVGFSYDVVLHGALKLATDDLAALIPGQKVEPVKVLPPPEKKAARPVKIK